MAERRSKERKGSEERKGFAGEVEEVTAVQDVPSIEETARLFVRNLPYSTTEADLAEAFREHGEVSEAHLVLDRWPHALTSAAHIHSSVPCMSQTRKY